MADPEEWPEVLKSIYPENDRKNDHLIPENDHLFRKMTGMMTIHLRKMTIYLPENDHLVPENDHLAPGKWPFTFRKMTI